MRMGEYMRMDGLMYELMCGFIYGLKDGFMDVWLDGLVYG